MSAASGNAPAWDRYTPRLPADQVLILRAALAAANLEALPDSSHNPQFADPLNLSLGRNERAPSHRIPLVAMIDGQPTPVVANVFGLRRQPFIAEVYANTLAGFDGAAAPAPPALVRPNPKGYVAIKIYNPTAVPISLQHCRLVGLHRTRNTPYTTSEAASPNMTVQPLAALTAGNADTTDQIDLGSTAITSNVLGAIYPPTVIPANGTLVLENIPGSGPAFPDTAAEDADYRPTSTGLLSANDQTDSGNLDPLRCGDNADDVHLNRYAFARGLFDQFLMIAPDRNYSPNYPTQPAWSPGTAYTAGDTAQYGQDIFVCRTAASSSTDPASSPNWLRLPRYLVARTDHDLDPLIPGQINLNTAPEAVLAALPWSPRRTADVSSDSLTFDFNAYLPAVTARGDGIDDNAQIAHAIVLYRDGRYGHTDGASANKLGTTASSQTWCAAAAPFRSLFDLYNVPGIRAAQNALLQAGGTKDFAGQTLLLDRASNLITTRSDAFTLYALVQGWKDAGTPQARLVVQRRVSLTMRRKLGGDGSSKSTVVSRIP